MSTSPEPRNSGTAEQPNALPFRLLVWGAGFFGRKWLETVKARPDCQVAGIMSRTPGRAGEVGRELGLADLPGYASLDEAVARGRAEAVIITLPQMFHAEAAVRAIRAGLHVLVEKPLAMTLAEARAILDAARGRPDRVVMVNQNFRWRPHTLALRGAVRDGLIGRPGHMSIECRQPIRRKTIDAWREEMAEPLLMDFAIHHFDLMRYLTGQEPREVVGTSFRPAWSWFAGNTAAVAVVTMEDGLVVSYNATMVSQGSDTPQEGIITIAGEKGTLQLDERSQVRWFGEGEPRTIPPVPVPEGELGHGLAEFVAATRGRRLPETHVADNIRSLALPLAVLESARRGQAVRMEELLSFLR